RLQWISPNGGSSLSGDPVAVMRGAPNPEAAQAFVEFVMCEQGQILWNAEPGSRAGPQEKALRRMPVRRDVYSTENRASFSDGQSNPYEDTGTFVYHPELTGKAFGTIRNLVKIIGIDSHEEMKHAWKAMREAGFPADAMKVFFNVSMLDYQQFGKGDPQLDSKKPLVSARRASELGMIFREQYKSAEQIALKAQRNRTTP
ncbi:MAG: extracellular solute-binding protein, partial [Verrucomicrobia bacterium]|nr:extracellular solute-binding protein [Verrucomicrobiota bacterium]